MSEAKPVFFSGGSALKNLSQYFAKRHFPTVHLITTFDSGGSSAALRKSFAMPAIGDLRNRLLALADPEKASSAAIAFCNIRLPQDVDRATAFNLLKHSLLQSPLLPQIPTELRHILTQNLIYFLERVPEDFDARGASLGNLVLTASYLKNNRDFEATLALFAPLFHVCGLIVPITDTSLQLAAILKNKQIIVGQHNFARLEAPVDSLFLTVHDSSLGLREESKPVFCHPPASTAARVQLENAALICYPMGSFFSSIVANLLPEGVGKSVARTHAPKVFIPNSGHDPELNGLTLAAQVEQILAHLKEDAPQARPSDFLNYVLIDREHGQYPGQLSSSLSRLKDLGIRVLDRSLIREEAVKTHMPEAIFHVLREIMAKGEAR